MNLLLFLADAFINTFGITQPSEAARRRAAWFILALLLITLCIVAIFSIGVYNFTRRHGTP